MSVREFDGKSLDEALRAASDALGRPEASIDYELVEGGRKGVFGLGARPVRIRIREEAASPEPVASARGPKGALAEAPAGRPRSAPRPPRSTRTPGPAPPDPPSPSVAAASGDPSSAAGTLRRMLELMDLDLEVEETLREGHLDLVLDGPDKKRLTSRAGELIEALEFVLNRMGRRSWPDSPPQRLICRGFSNTRDEELVDMVREVASQVAHSGQPKRLQAMNPYERRVVHVTIREFPGLKTISEGDGFLKRVRVEKAGS